MCLISVLSEAIAQNNCECARTDLILSAQIFRGKQGQR